MRAEIRANLLNWDDRVDIHFASSLYDVDGFVAGRSTLPEVDLVEVGDVTGRSLVQLQCHSHDQSD